MLDQAPPAPVASSDSVLYPHNPRLQELADLSNFRARGVIDFIKLRFQTKEPTQFRWVQDSLNRTGILPSKPYIERHSILPGGSTDDFVVVVHDPQDHAHLLEIVQAVGQRSPLKFPVTVEWVEVSIDFYSRTHDRQQLEAMTLRLKHCLQHTAVYPSETNNMRQSVEAAHHGSLRADTTRLAVECLKQKMCDKWQTCQGCWERAFRVYLKTVDDNKTPLQDIKLHRSRVEVSLRGSNIPADFREIREDAHFKFESLAKHFAFTTIEDWTLPDNGKSAHAAATKRILDLAARFDTNNLKPTRKQRRKTSHRVQADGHLKARVRDALRGLTDRHFGYTKKPGESRESSPGQDEERS